MKSFLDVCCGDPKHTPENPCEHFVACCTEGPLCHHDPKIAEEIKQLNLRLTYKVHEKPIIFIGMGTCGLASGADKVYQTIKTELEKLNIDAEIVSTGCIGYCAKEPIVDIKLPDGERLAYAEVTPADVPELLKKSILEKSIYVKKYLGSHELNSQVNKKLTDENFFKNQYRIVLQNCGVINPDSIDEYIAAGGFKALDKALRQMTGEEVVREMIDSGLR